MPFILQPKRSLWTDTAFCGTFYLVVFFSAVCAPCPR